jgi:anti-sigma factor ChrR (cupin superfamily)
MGHVDDQLWELALGMLSPEERAAVERHLAECAACRDELSHASEMLAMVALDLPPVEPPPALRDRLLASTAGRFVGVIDRVAELFDLTRDAVVSLLGSLPTADWQPSGIPGVDLIHVTPGPRVAGADAGFIRFQPGTQFPLHRHVGDEVMLILEGEVVENDGRRGHPGDAMYREAGSSHAFVVGESGCLAAVLLVGGIEINGQPYRVG